MSPAELEILAELVAQRVVLQLSQRDMAEWPEQLRVREFPET